MRRIGTALALALGLAGCAGVSTGPGETELRGHYSWGFEVSSFQPCGAEESWWVAADAGLGQRYLEITTRQYDRVYVELRGEVGPEGKFGHLGAYPRELNVREVVEVRAAGANDCR